MIKREKYLNQLIDSKDNGFPKVITGIRRCGKSFLLREIYREKWQALSEELTMPAALEICAGLDQMFVKENVV